MPHKSNPSDAFDEIYQVILGVIRDHMASLVVSGKYVSINATDTETNRFYVIVFTSEAYTLQYNTIIDVKIITVGNWLLKHNLFVIYK